MKNIGGHEAAGLPGWLAQKEPAREIQAGRARSGRAGRAAERTLRAVLSFAADTLFNETVSRKKGFLQMVEPRVKIALLAFLLVWLSLVKSPAGMLPYAGFCLLMAGVSGVPLRAYAKRLLPGVLLASMIALPAALNVIVDGEPILVLFSFERPISVLGHEGPHDIFISRQGAMSAAGLVLRVACSMMLVFLAGFTTAPARLVKAVGFFMPGFARTVFSVSYRYMYFFARRLEEFLLARRARGAHSSMSGGRAAQMAAAVFLLGLELRRELSLAMEARGMGYVRREPWAPFRPTRYDMLFLLCAAGLAVFQ